MSILGGALDLRSGDATLAAAGGSRMGGVRGLRSLFLLFLLEAAGEVPREVVSMDSSCDGGGDWRRAWVCESKWVAWISGEDVVR